MDEEKDIEIKSKEDNKSKIEESNNKKKNNRLIVFFKNFVKILIILVLMVSVFYVGVKYSDYFTHKAYSQSIGFKDVGELVTQTAYIRVFEDSSENRKLFEKTILPTLTVPFTESRKIFSYMIQVDASINFEETVVEKIDDETKTIYILLPHSRIRNTTPDYDSFKSHLDSESLFSRIDSTEQNELFKDMMVKAKEDAISNGILEKADENGKKLIENFIKGNEKYKDYSIEFNYIEGE